MTLNTNKRIKLFGVKGTDLWLVRSDPRLSSLFVSI